MPVRHGLGKGIERLVRHMNQQTFEPAVDPRSGQRRGGGNLRGPQRGGEGTRQGAKRGRYHTEPPSQESVRAFHRRARACHQTRGRSELWGILTSMTPEAIVDTALREGLRVVSITDHNWIGNVPRALRHAHGKDVLVVPGVELSTPQGHLLVYCPTHDDLARFFGKLTVSRDRKTCAQTIV